MSGVHLRPEITTAQRCALRWLHNRGGSGCFTKGQVLLAQGELAAVKRSTWNALASADPACITYSGGNGYKRVGITEAGTVLALTWTGRESDTVEDEFDA